MNLKVCLSLMVLATIQVVAANSGGLSNRPSPVASVSAVRPNALPKKHRVLSIRSFSKTLQESESEQDYLLRRRQALRDLAILQDLKVFKHSYDQELTGLELNVVLDHLDLIPKIDRLLGPWSPNWNLLRVRYKISEGADARDYVPAGELKRSRVLLLDPKKSSNTTNSELPKSDGSLPPLILVDRQNYQKLFGSLIKQRQRLQIKKQARDILVEHGVDLVMAINLVGVNKLGLDLDV